MDVAGVLRLSAALLVVSVVIAEAPGRPRSRRGLSVALDPQARCDLCRDNWLLIIGAGGRTGSTTALSMFDAIPGFEIAGEHWGLLHDEYNIMEHVRDIDGRSSPSWSHNPIDTHALLCSIQERMKRLVLGAEFDSRAASTKVIGFKEVRYHTLEMLHFLKEVFPCSRFIFTYRKRPQAIVRAKFGFGTDYNSKWLSATPLFKRVHDLFDDTCSMFGVEALTTKHYNRVLHDKLGVLGCNYTHIIHDNADGGYEADENKGGLLSGECDLSQVDFRLSPYELERREALWQQLVLEHKADQDKANADGDY